MGIPIPTRRKTALDAKRGTLFLVPPEDITIIGLDTEDGPEHPLFDERVLLPVDEALARNIQIHGVIEPVVIRKNGDDVIEVIDGRQRVRSARLANKRLEAEGKEPVLVPVVRRVGVDAQHYGVMISANELRRDDTPLARARKAGRYLAMGRTEEDAAEQFGVDVATVRGWLRLLDLAPEVQEAVEAGKLSALAAKQVAGLTREEQVEMLPTLLDATGAEARAVVKARRVARAKAEERASAPASGENEPEATDCSGASAAPPNEPVGLPPEPLQVPPGKRVLRKLLTAVEKGDVALEGQTVALLMWIVTGDPGMLPGLADALRGL